MINKFMFVLSLILFGGMTSNAQVSYSYDLNGNRIARELVIGSNKSATLMDDFEESPQVDSMDNSKIKIYPNPTYGLLKIELEPINDELYSIYIYNLSGSMVFQMPVAEEYNVVDLTSCDKGIYIMEIVKGNDKKTWRVIKK